MSTAQRAQIGHTPRPRSLSSRPLRMAFAVLLVTVVLLFPVYWMIVTSLVPTSEMLTRDPALFPDFGTLSIDAYKDVLLNRPVLSWLGNSTIITIASAMIATTVSALGGYSLSRFKTRGHSAMGYSLLFSRMLPGTLIVIPFFVMASTLGLANNLLSVVAINVAAIIPFSTWMLKSFFDGIPVELEQAARVDGCTYLGAMSRVTLPLSAPGLVATFTYSSILAWSDFLFSRTLLTDQDRWPITVGISSFVGEYSIDWSGLMAISMVSSIPLIILFIALEPFLVRGLTSGAVKG
jgi:multiple sugar transport system permease protein